METRYDHEDRLIASGLREAVFRLYNGEERAGADLAKLVGEASAISSVIRGLHSRYNRKVVEQAAILGVLNPKIFGDLAKATAAAPYIAQRLDALAEETGRGWQGTFVEGQGFHFERTVRGVKEVAIIDPALLGSADARKLDEFAAALQGVYVRTGHLRRKGEDTPIHGPLDLFEAVTAPVGPADDAVIIGSGLTAGTVSLLVGASLPWAFVAALAGGFGADLLRKWRAAQIPCEHAIAGGRNQRKCPTCAAQLAAEDARLAAEWVAADEKVRAEQAEAERRRRIGVDAARLRWQESKRLADALAPDISELRELSPQAFEDEMARMFERLGYDVEQTPYSHDGGRDAVLRKNGKIFLLECKKYAGNGTSGRPDLQKFHSAMITDRAVSGFFVTTGGFTSEALKFAAKERIEPIDQNRLRRLLFESRPAAAEDDSYQSMCLECGDVVAHRLRAPRTASCRNGHAVAPTLTIQKVFSGPGRRRGRSVAVLAR